MFLCTKVYSCAYRTYIHPLRRLILTIMISSRYLKCVPRLYTVSNEILNHKTVPSIPTHELFTKLNFVSHPKPGLVHWMPLGTAVLDKLRNLVHKELQIAGAEQVSLSSLSHSSLWEQTGRWGGTELFKLKDSSGADYCLAPTCEEEITHLVKTHVNSYKNLPLLYYQINTKFRDEKRPRSGLLRGREFIMKDAYSFDVSEEDALKTYDTMVETYYRIFEQLKVPFVKADADTGEIGGSLSHEWHYVHPTGEDTLYTCSECGNTLNVEKTLSYPLEEQQHNDVSVRYFMTTDQETLVCAYYPASRNIQPLFVKNEIPDLDLSETLLEDEILSLFEDEDTLINKKIVRMMDSRLNSRSNFPDFPINFINRSLITTLTDIPLVEAEEGELCYHCEEGHLEKSRAIEVGHTFYLGDKYSSTLDCSVELPQADGKMARRNILMGCYGIGISRIIASVAEINRDSAGFRWPRAIAPWEVTVVNAGTYTNSELVAKLESLGIDYRVDNREKVGLGRKVKESNAIGIPLVVIVGKKYPYLEVEVRGKREKNKWKDIQETSQFAWEVDYTDNIDTKHTVHVNDIDKVVKVLLADM